MDIQKLSIEKLNPSAYNPRKDLKPGDAEYEKLRRSIEEFGYVEPIIWNNRTAILSVAINGTRYWWHSDIPLWIAWCWTSMSKRKKP